MEIFWTPYTYKHTNLDTEWIDLAYFPPEPMMRVIAEERSKDTTFMQCFGMIEYFKNAFVLRSPIDYTLTVDADGTVSTKERDQAFFNAFVKPRTDKGDTHRAISLSFGYLFFATRSVSIEALPMFLTHSDLNDALKVIPGTFDIGQWVRPVEVAFEVKDGVNEIAIKRGDPLLCLRFNTDEKIKLTRTDQTDDVTSVVQACTGLKIGVKKQPLAKCYELGKYAVQRFLKKYKRCPFR